MGTVYKKSATRALPPDAELFVRKGERLARWKDAKGQTRTAPVTTGRNGNDRVVIVARTYMAKYRDGSGVVREVTTGCRGETAARQVLAELERRADKVRSGIRTAAEDSAVDHMAMAIETHFVAYTGTSKRRA